MRLSIKLIACISAKYSADESLSGSTDNNIGTACFQLFPIGVRMFLHKLLKLGFAFFGFQQFFDFFNEYGSKRIEGFFGNIRLKNNFRIVNKRHLLNFVASISAGGGHSKIHHKFLLTGGDGCHRPVFICPWLLPYISVPHIWGRCFQFEIFLLNCKLLLIFRVEKRKIDIGYAFSAVA